MSKQITWRITEEQAEQILFLFELSIKSASLSNEKLAGLNTAKVAVPLVDSLVESVSKAKHANNRSRTRPN